MRLKCRHDKSAIELVYHAGGEKKATEEANAAYNEILNDGLREEYEDEG